MYSAILMAILAVQPVILDRDEQAGPKKMPCMCMTGFECVCKGGCKCKPLPYSEGRVIAKNQGGPHIVFFGVKPRPITGAVISVWDQFTPPYDDNKFRIMISVNGVHWTTDLPANATDAEIRRAAFPPAPRMESGADGGQRLQPMFVGSPRSSRGGC